MYIMDLPDKLVACAAAIWPLFLEYETPLDEKDLDVVELTPTDGLLTSMAAHGRLSTTSHGLYPKTLPTKNNMGDTPPTSWIDTKDDLINILKLVIRIRIGGVLWIVLQPHKHIRFKPFGKEAEPRKSRLLRHLLVNLHRSRCSGTAVGCGSGCRVRI